MEFNDNRPIYLQISDLFCERILSGELKAGDRIPSVREFGAEIGVNPNTVMRTYDKLLDSGVFFNKRGIGYFVCEGAVNVSREREVKAFIDEQVPAFLRRAALLGVDLREILK